MLVNTKKGQIAAFAVIGLVVLLFSLFIASLILVKKPTQDFTETLELFPPEKFVSYCVSQGLQRYFDSDWYIHNRSVERYNGDVYVFTYIKNQGHIPFNYADYENALATHLNRYLDSCIDVSLYEEQGYTALRDAISTSVRILESSVQVDVQTQLNIKKNDLIITKDSFSILQDLPLGKLFRATSIAVNSELAFGTFDQVAYMSTVANQQGNDALILIEKHKPYPHILYDVLLTYKQFEIPLRFAIEGEDVFLDSYIKQDYFTPSTTSCQTPTVCYNGMFADSCLAIGGEMRQTPCETEQARSAEFDSCGQFASGQSWCDISIGVGSRHIRSYCFNGKIYSEPCRDFRQEVCVSENTQAYC